MASSISVSTVGLVAGYVDVFGVGFVSITFLISFPFLVGSTVGAGYVGTRPLDVGSSVSIFMGWSSLVIMSRSVRSIRLVVGVGAGAIW